MPSRNRRSNSAPLAAALSGVMTWLGRPGAPGWTMGGRESAAAGAATGAVRHAAAVTVMTISAASGRKVSKNTPLEAHSNTDLIGARRDEVRAGEGRKEVVQRLLVRQVDDVESEAHFAFVRTE